MRKIVLTLMVATICTCSFGQKKFATAAGVVVPSSLFAYTRKVSDSIVVDSTRMNANCYFYQVGNPYVDTATYRWCQFEQITITIKGNAKSSYIINSAKKQCEAWRKVHYPNVP